MDDIIIIGGGIVGLSTAYALTERFPHARLRVVEKEDQWAKHQTGNNSGVIHSGIYYKPGSLKARFAKAGSEQMKDFCAKYDINYESCGKVIVATKQTELPLLQNLFERGLANGLDIFMIDPEQLKVEEPYVQGLQAIKVPQAGIVDYKQVCETLVLLLKNQGIEMVLNTEINDIYEHEQSVEVIANDTIYKTSYVVNCGGLHSDRITKMTGLKPDLQIVPFRGEYYELKEKKHHLVKNLIYPVPNPDFPFLGVHFTRMVNGGVEAGPNALLSLKREGYRKTDFDLKDFTEVMFYGGFWRLAAKYWQEGARELWRSYNKKAFVKSLQELIPSIQEDDLESAPSGVRAQALQSNGKLVDDFFIVTGKRSIHVCNAPSPAATACFPIGREIAGRVPEIGT
ncbi:L-2-hydroxyglutarate oxidase [Chengkuizengella axinellae]|uniref:L-2-hydroxyglutarate oxidase n=1 Tax=Chengkuizengella axinellae TaxID=3064388 RepID=A0ABT9J309_9BACL|nr:L-2-hydroxyglutarate oxidase [Chengkuizengella sp. 2205SS18-9]MDP5276007.1 L-2-hydroxyglutarate oxidase [Chengkuizengella sp. 2205SS18-9]